MSNRHATMYERRVFQTGCAANSRTCHSFTMSARFKGAMSPNFGACRRGIAPGEHRRCDLAQRGPILDAKQRTTDPVRKSDSAVGVRPDPRGDDCSEQRNRDQDSVTSRVAPAPRFALPVATCARRKGNISASAMSKPGVRGTVRRQLGSRAGHRPKARCGVGSAARCRVTSRHLATSLGMQGSEVATPPLRSYSRGPTSSAA
jgi:hypothetical protein